MAYQMLDDFEDGDMSEWTTSYFSADTSRTYSGTYSAYTGQNTPSGDFHDYRTVVSGGRQIKKLEFYWQETTWSYGAGIQLKNSNGNWECGFQTDNPQWYLSDGTGSYNQIYAGDGYDRWVRVEFVFDWEAGSYSYTVEDLSSGTTRTGSFDLKNGVDIETIQYVSACGGTTSLSSPDNCSGDRSELWIDNIRYDPGVTGTVKVQTGSGPVSLPVFPLDTGPENVHEMVRVQTPNGVGFVPFVPEEYAAYPYLRIQTQNYGVLAAHDSRPLIFLDSFVDTGNMERVALDGTFVETVDTSSAGAWPSMSKNRIYAGSGDDIYIYNWQNTSLESTFSVPEGYSGPDGLHVSGKEDGSYYYIVDANASNPNAVRHRDVNHNAIWLSSTPSTAATNYAIGGTVSRYNNTDYYYAMYADGGLGCIDGSGNIVGENSDAHNGGSDSFRDALAPGPNGSVFVSAGKIYRYDTNCSEVDSVTYSSATDSGYVYHIETDENYLYALSDAGNLYQFDHNFNRNWKVSGLGGDGELAVTAQGVAASVGGTTYYYDSDGNQTGTYSGSCRVAQINWTFG